VRGGKKKAAKSTCIKEFTNSNKFTIIKTADDGNCFYDTLSKFGQMNAFATLNKPHLVLRQAVVKKLLEDIDEISPYFVNNSGNPLTRGRIEEEIRELGKPNVWDSNGGDIVIQYAASVFNITISIFDVKDSDPRDVINRIVFSPTEGAELVNVNMLRVNDSHYMLLLPTEGPESGILPRGKKTVMSRRKTNKNKTKSTKNNYNSNNSLQNALKKIAIMESSFVVKK